MSSPTPLRAPGTARTVPRPAWPDWPAPEATGGFPLVASLAPLVAAGAIWALTRSPYALLFAVAAPLAALGGLLDRRVRRRRRVRRAVARGRDALDALAGRIAATRAEDVRRLEMLAPDPGAPGARAPGVGAPGTRTESAWVRVGRGTLLVTPLLDRPAEVPAALAEDVSRIADAAERIPDAPVLVPLGSIGVLGPRLPREAVLRHLAVQVCALLPETGTIRVPDDAAWAAGLPRAVRGGTGYELPSPDGLVVLAGAERDADLPGGLSSLIRLGDGEPARIETVGVPLEVEDLRIAMLSGPAASLAVDRIAAAVRILTPALPDRVELVELGGSDARSETGLGTVLGLDVDGPVQVDLVRDGPHAIVGGTTGSGKSELLLAWVTGLAERHPPDEVAFLLIDFKGGSTFDALRPLPHVIGAVSDLDPGTARRATTSLRREVLRRESLLAADGVRDVADARGLGRLVVVVDEYAALVEQHPELHALIADLAARGRSLGIHLILCTQRPAGVIRDAVLANAGLRISLRVHDPGDSRAVVGSDAAAELPAVPPGRAILRGADGRRRTIQCAVASPADIARAAESGGGRPAPFRPWAPPLPIRARVASVESGAGGTAVPFGILDLPEEQRLGTAEWDPRSDGNLLVLGGRGAGTTSALGTLAAGCGDRSVVVPRSPADAWAVLHETLTRGGAGEDRTVVVVDDVDLILDECDEDGRPAMIRLLAALARELPDRGGALILGAARLPTAATPLLSRIDSRLLLRLPDREQHVLAGGAGGDWGPRRPPGRGWWAGAEVQVALADATPPARTPAVPVATLDERPPLGVVCTHPDALADRIRALGRTLIAPADDPGTLDRPVRVGDPDEWMDAWSVLETVRRSGTLLVADCTPRELRTLTRIHADAPLLDPRRAEAWRVRGRRVERVRMSWPARG